MYGVVKDNVVLLPEGVNLSNGTEVEIRPLSPGDERPQQSTEDAFLQRLLDAGLLTEFKTPPTTPPKRDRMPLKIRGKPLSQMVIEDRW